MEQLFVIVHRRLDGYEQVYTTHDFDEAIYTQKMLFTHDAPVEYDPEIAKDLFTDEEIETIIHHLDNGELVRYFNDVEEVAIFYLPQIERLR